jgi:hydroxymethylpyrimidine kinase/phosphomethylpyrimidine kinase/thiamine-phosphate diphosphorylase
VKDAKATSYGPVNITHFPSEQIDLPLLTHKPIDTLAISSFPECNQPLLGLYPVVERAEWIARLASTGVSTMQLRVKDLSGDELESEIKLAVELGVKHNCRLFINDYWQLAIKHNAYGVHLGQEDLNDANIYKIKKAGLRLGLSTHCHYEVARAHSYKPSYIACGPVYHTTTKDMPWVPHGLNGLKYWRRVLNYPLVAIGGINAERFGPVAKTGVDSVAMITAITLADKPCDVVIEFMKKFEQSQVSLNLSI